MIFGDLVDSNRCFAVEQNPLQHPPAEPDDVGKDIAQRRLEPCGTWHDGATRARRAHRPGHGEEQALAANGAGGGAEQRSPEPAGRGKCSGGEDDEAALFCRPNIGRAARARVIPVPPHFTPFKGRLVRQSDGCAARGAVQARWMRAQRNRIQRDEVDLSQGGGERSLVIGTPNDERRAGRRDFTHEERQGGENGIAGLVRLQLRISRHGEQAKRRLFCLMRPQKARAPDAILPRRGGAG